MATSNAHLAARLGALLAERGLTQAELARRTGIGSANINKFVHAKRRPNAWEIGALAYVLEVELLDLLGVADEVADGVAEEVARLTDELARQLDEAARAADRHARELAAANQARSALRDELTTLESQLRVADRARASADAQAKRLRTELEAAKERIAKLESVDKGYARYQPTVMPQWNQSWLVSEEAQEFELARAKAKLIGQIAGTGVELFALLYASSRR